MSAERWRNERPETPIEQVYEKRRRAYRKKIEDLKGLGQIDENSGIGFVLDAVIGQLAASAQVGEITLTSEMSALLTRIQQVKQAYPKPK